MIPKKRDEITGRLSKENILNREKLTCFEMDNIFLSDDWFYGEIK